MILNISVFFGAATSTLSTMAAATGTLSAAERSYPTSEVRGRSREDPMPNGRWPRGSTPQPRSGAAARRSYPMPPRPGPGAVAERSNPMPEARGGGWEDQPHTMAARAQEGLEELPHVEGQERRW